MSIETDIKEFYKEYCEEEEIKFSEKEFKEFFDFLLVDLYDWFNENANQFFKQKFEKENLVSHSAAGGF